ncbi:27137_t:CDS:1, partial [Racocetra persica]
EDSKKLDDLLKGFGYQAPAKTSDEVNPDFQKLPHPFDKNKTTYFSDFIKTKLGDKTFNDTNLTLADFIAERSDYGSLISHLGYSPITFDNTNL